MNTLGIGAGLGLVVLLAGCGGSGADPSADILFTLPLSEDEAAHQDLGSRTLPGSTVRVSIQASSASTLLASVALDEGHPPVSSLQFGIGSQAPAAMPLYQASANGAVWQVEVPKPAESARAQVDIAWGDGTHVASGVFDFAVP
ncbi:MAG: hypothetical protein PF961_01800 [Planctomycetota bacterium]|jgi:hypothetical protein|nr:hypothetical protein [Planctomycetota bacterium]